MDPVASWIFGARIDTLLDAPESPGIHTIHAQYVPEQLVTEDASGAAGHQIRVIAKPSTAMPIQITVHH
jgi:hypothetical protein